MAGIGDDDYGNVAGNSAGGSSKSSDFLIEYAKSSEAKCKGCSKKIPQGEVYISILDDSQCNGVVQSWSHVECFVKAKQQFGFNDSVEKLPGFQTLKAEDQQMVKQKDGSKGVKRKAESDEPGSKAKVLKTDKEEITLSKEERMLKEQNNLLLDTRNKIGKSFSKNDMIRLLKHNEQHVSTEEQCLLDNLADCLVFGALKKCPLCKSSTCFMSKKYKCNGSTCQYQTEFPERKIFYVPGEFKEKYPFLKDYKCTVKDKVVLVTLNNLPLNNFKICMFGRFKTLQMFIKEELELFGAKVQKNIDGTINLCISTPTFIASPSLQVVSIRSLGIPVVSYGFVEAIKKGLRVPQSIEGNLLSTWGKDRLRKFGIKDKSEKSEKSGELESFCHVFQKKDDVYKVTLAYVEVSPKWFYKLQILESNSGSEYYFCRQWVQVGTTVGAKEVDVFPNAFKAISSFEALYRKKTGNEWLKRKHFVKKPCCMFPIDAQGCEQIVQKSRSAVNSTLPKDVQELIYLLFNVEDLKKAAIEFGIDVKIRPLGEFYFSFHRAYQILQSAQQILASGGNRLRINSLSKEFFTCVPHSLGWKQPLLDNQDIIKSKIKMLDSLLEIDFAYKLLTRGHIECNEPVDELYKILKTDIEPLPENSKEFEIVKTYLDNTHDSRDYNLILQGVFKINRHGEKERHLKFKELHNKKLLWHGSRLCNHVGILSRGLCIAPREARTSGAMFGKGIYFADMVTKSVPYCYTSKKNPTCLLLLCEVALGNMYNKARSEFFANLPPNKHSTLGMGMREPNPAVKTYIGDVEVPYGKPIQTKNRTDLQLNEYVVYDTNQIRMKYLLRAKCDFKY